MRTVLRRRWHSFVQYRTFLGWVPAWLLAGVVMLHVVAGLAVPAVLWGMGLAVDAATRSGEGLAFALLLCGVGLVLQQGLAPAQVWASAEVSQRVDARVSSALVETCDRSGLRALEDDLVVSRVRDVSESLSSRWDTPGEATGGALALVSRYVTLAASVGLLGWVAGWWVGLLGLVIALVNRLGQTFALSVWSTVNRRRAPNRRRMSYLRELATDPLLAREVRKLRLHGWLAQRYRWEARRHLAPLWYARRTVLGWRFVGYSVVSLALGGLLLWLGVAHLSGQGPVSAGQLTVLIQACVVCVLFGVMFPESDIRMLYGLAPWDSLRAVADTLAVEPRAPLPASPAVPPSAPAAVRVDGVRFGYLPGLDVLAGVDLDLPAGTSTALVGVNGAGKSTLVKLLAGYYSPDTGEVRVDGAPLASTAGRVWQGGIAVLFQDYLTYQLSLRENVVMQSARNSVDDQVVVACLEQVGLAPVVARLERGLDTPLSRLLPGGTELSGGQWQRLALARALYAVRTGARLLVMDEPTSQLDARGEAEFYRQFLELTEGVTTLVISHRFSSVRRADRIAVLDGGVITERGSHDELLAAGGTYARMFTAQAARYGL
ncbi:ABC transporter ATP-binding protein [Propionicimonas sp.]|uniref:ABC transporter ATP-binding protein n=1 Tax=Propionicimonas sp. TaxID=1955623 RepID=UPI0039E29A3F